MEKIINNSNHELLKNMKKTFEELDNYELCYEIKNKYNIIKFDLECIQKILNTEYGAYDLYHFFNEIKDDEQLNYLQEILVINNESCEKIQSEYLPELKEIINQREKRNKSKDKDDSYELL